MYQEKGGRLAETEKKLNVVDGNLAKLVAKSKTTKDNIQTEERRKKHLEKSLKDVCMLYSSFYLLLMYFIFYFVGTAEGK